MDRPSIISPRTKVLFNVQSITLKYECCLEESLNFFSGGLVYSHDLQTCDWPRNVACQSRSTNERTVSGSRDYSTNERHGEAEAENSIVTDSKKVSITIIATCLSVLLSPDDLMTLIILMIFMTI